MIDKKELDPKAVNIHNDDEMRKNGLWRPYNVTPRDPDVWTKTNKERKLLNKLKYSWKKKDMHFWNIPEKRGTVTAKLIIQLKKNNKFDKTTYSFICRNSEIKNFLNNFTSHNHKTGKVHNYVAKYSYNGKTYFSD